MCTTVVRYLAVTVLTQQCFAIVGQFPQYLLLYDITTQRYDSLTRDGTSEVLFTALDSYHTKMCHKGNIIRGNSLSCLLCFNMFTLFQELSKFLEMYMMK